MTVIINGHSFTATAPMIVVGLWIDASTFATVLWWKMNRKKGING